MRIARFWRQIAAWLGLLAIGLDAFTPLASVAGPAHAPVRIGICTTSGFRYLPDVPDVPSAPPTPAERTQCTLCAHCAPSGSHAAITAAGPVPVLPWPDRVRPAPRYASTLSFTHWIPGARPRAPPPPFAVS